MKLGSILLAMLVLAGCSCEGEKDRAQAVRLEPQQPPRRLNAPPSGTVRMVPPHAIRADGVGPYRLGEKISAVMAQLPSGPRIARFEIPGVVRTSVIRAEEDTVLIGGEMVGTAMFVAVVGVEVARTDSNVHVGSSLDDLVRAAGPLVEDPEHARDPRLVVPGALRNARVVLEGDRIAAIVVTSDRSQVKLGPQPEAECKRPVGSGRKQLGACLSAAGELIDLEDEELVVHPADSERVIQTLPTPGLVFAAPLRNPSDGRDELVIVSRLDEPGQRTWTLVAYRMEGGKLVRSVDREVLYELSSTQSRWIGADLKDVDLHLELASRPDAIEVGGVLTTRTGTRVRDVVLLSPKVVTRRHRKPGPAGGPEESSDAGAGDARSAPSGGRAAAPGSSGGE